MSDSSPSPLRSPEDEELLAKSSRIRLWVTKRMKELEDQNERLRAQNLRCTTQLQMLRSFTEKSRKIKAEMEMSRSITGTLPVLRDENRTSDDSGLTSDDTDRKQMSVSISECTPRVQRKANRTMLKNTSQGSSTSESSPCEDEAKPMPLPRRVHQTTTERDSLNSYAEDYEYDIEESSFERAEEGIRNENEKYADYVNLHEFVAIKDDKVVYSEIVKHRSVEKEFLPALPSHQPRHWESRLIQAAEKCLSVVDGADSEGTSTGPSVSPYHVSDVSRISSNNRTESPGSRKSSKLSRNSSPRVPSHHSYEDGTAYAIRDLCLGSDYYTPPDASARYSAGTPNSRTSLIPSRETMEKAGYWTHLTDSRIKSLKRRYVIFKNGHISFYRKHGNRDEEPVTKINIADIRSVSKIEQQGAAYAFQLVTATDKMNFMTESEKTTHDWVTILTAAIKATTLREMASRVTPIDASISGWMTRVKCGLSKKVFAALVNQKLMFFKNSNDLVPNGFLCIQGAQISEKQNGTEEYSGSSDEQLETTKDHPNQRKNNDSLCVQIANEDPVYLILRTSEDKEKWLYFLKSASGSAALCGTTFEILVQRMMAENVGNDSPLWKDLLFTSGEEIPKDTMTSVDPSERKKTLEIARACQLFVSVLMRPQATQYHIDLAQNILSTAVQQEYLRNEVYSQLIKMTSGSMPFGLQGWKLLALTIPLFLPKQYSLLWLLKKHISRWVDLPNESDETRMAIFCESALDRCLRVGGRQEGPSRLEVTSVLTRDVTRTKFPHSISVKLPNSEYQIVEFDGSTEIGQCLSSLCLKLGMRPALLSGYALYMNDPLTHSLLLLKGKQKLCDALSTWETHSRDAQRGRVSNDCAAALSLRMRHYWSHLKSTETPIERQFLVWRASEEIVNGRIPLSNQLCESLAALYAQMVFGDANHSLSDQQFDFIGQRFYPAKMLDVACIKSLRLQINTNWSELIGMSEQECVRVILQVLNKWPLFGSDLHEASMRTDNERKIYLALNDHSVSLLDRRHFDVIRTFPYSSLSTFGQFQQDFMLTVIRPLTPGSHPDEAPKERLTFSMQKNEIEQLTLHLAEYIRCQKLVWKVSK
ncbi:CRE-MAX-1 protein [Caenorhabditis remanei]|uniref:CRE-MAX-1 protein n=1 Tax=Caenorhabditis remanei TaxID=31234 RepID=E3LU32_CAERE|nr:CRE-MAX-1 protein [Caenorhabditis remanei]